MSAFVVYLVPQLVVGGAVLVGAYMAIDRAYDRYALCAHGARLLLVQAALIGLVAGLFAGRLALDMVVS